MVLQFIVRKIRTRRKFLRRIFSAVLRLLNRLTNFKLYLIMSILFWWYCSKANIGTVSNYGSLTVFVFYYLLISLIFVSFRFLRRFSRFIAIPLGLIVITIVPFVYALTSPTMTADPSPISFYRYFYLLSLPIGIAGVILILNSIPAYFCLIFRRPQYFLFSFVCLVSLLYFSTLEYRFYSDLNGYNKFLCSYQDTRKTNSPKVVRIIGTYGEGTGFFLDAYTVVTNRHVVEGEDYPKVVLPTGGFVSPVKVQFSPIYDIAFIRIDNPQPDLVINSTKSYLEPGEEVLSFGYALGSDIKGSPTILPLRFESKRELPEDSTYYLQFSPAIVSGMSGGPVFDKCGDFVGINTMSSSGTSLIIYPSVIDSARMSELKEAQSIELRPGITPRDSVFAYYYLLKARDTKGCYGLLSSYYKTKSSYEEWTARFPDVISVEVFKVQEIKKDVVYVFFGMVEWVNGERTNKVYEGTWDTIMDDGMYYLNKSHIVELESFYAAQGPEFFLNPEGKK